MILQRTTLTPPLAGQAACCSSPHDSREANENAPSYLKGTYSQPIIIMIPSKNTIRNTMFAQYHYLRNGFERNLKSAKAFKLIGVTLISVDVILSKVKTCTSFPWGTSEQPIIATLSKNKTCQYPQTAF